MQVSIKKLCEAGKMAERLEYFGYKATYGGSKGHGFWIQGHGWKSLKECDAMLPY